MDDYAIFIDVERYQRETLEERRMLLATYIIHFIQPQMRLVIFGKVHPNDFDDVLQETLKAILLGLDSFSGKSEEKFYAWCTRIARNKVNDQLRKRYAKQNQTVSMDDLKDLVLKIEANESLTPQDKLDLEFSLNLLEKSKPGCRNLVWEYFVIGYQRNEMAKIYKLRNDAAKRRVDRCLDLAQKLLGE